jgi:hypothetical protein
MRNLIALALVLTVMAPLPAIAYTQEDIEACAPDAMRLCQQAFPDMRRIALCLVKYKRNLNPACTMAYNRVRSANTSREQAAIVEKSEF